MRYNSEVLSSLLSVLESPEPSLETGRPEIPEVLQPTFTPGTPTRNTLAGGGVRSDSHFADDLRTVANAAQSTGTLTTLRKGVWRITGTYQYCCSAVAAPTSNVLRAQQGGASIGFLAGFISHTATLVQGVVKLDTQLTLHTDTDLVNVVGATGVGERVSVDVTLHCQRIA